MKLVIDPENIESAQDIGGNAGDNYTKMKMSFNSLMTEFVVSRAKTTYVCTYQDES